MKPIFLLSAHLSVFFGTVLLSMWFMTRTTPAARRLYGVARIIPASTDELSGTSGSLKATIFRILHQCFGRFSTKINQKLQLRFQAAGLRTQNDIDLYFAIRLMGPVAILVLWTFFRDLNVLLITVMAAGFYLGPDLWLTTKIKRRREQVRLGLPDALDLMVVCVDAGLGLDQALQRAGQELEASHPAIADEFTQINLEQRAGKPRINAWKDMADRTQLEAVKGFATMLAQCDRFGTPISRALSTFADDLRRKRSQLAQEMAAKTTVKLMFPLVLFIFPSMFIVLLGPAALAIARNLGTLSGK